MPSVVVKAGNVGSGTATVKVYAADGTTLATVYKDANGDDTGTNPLPKHKATGYFGLDNAGNYTVYLVPGDYQLGVTPAGGSETKTPFTVAAPVVEVQTVFTEVFGTPADGDVPKWNDTTKRFEWAAPSAASGAPTATARVVLQTSADNTDPSLPVTITQDGAALVASVSCPVTVPPLGAGQQFAAAVVLPALSGTVTATAEISVSNQGGTEQLIAYSTVPVALTPNSLNHLGLTDTFDAIGTDLSLVANAVHTAAGGVYSATLTVLLTWTP